MKRRKRGKAFSIHQLPGGANAKAGEVRDVTRSLGREDPLEEGVATHSSILAWRIPWIEEPGGLVYGVTKNRMWPKQLSAPLGRSNRPDVHLAFLSFNLCFWSMHFFPGLCCQEQGCICLCRSCGFFWCWITPLLRRLNCKEYFLKFSWIHDVCIILQIGKAVSHTSS